MRFWLHLVAVAALAAAATPGRAAAQEVSGRAVTGAVPLVGDREIFQPGTQPCTIPGDATSCFHTAHTDDFDRKFHPAQNDLIVAHSGELPATTDGDERPSMELVCANCHSSYGPEAPFDTWRGTMMAQSWRDPLARAALAVANHGLSQAKINFTTGLYDDGPNGTSGRTAGDYCIRCHSPVGWLEGNSLPADGSQIRGKQMDGVQCDACHRMVNPISHTYDRPSEYNVVGGLPNSVLDPTVKQRQYVPKLHNGNFVMNDTGRKIGPYADPVDIGQHPLDAISSHEPPELHRGFDTAAAENRHFVRNSQMCAVCHNVTNPILRVPEGYLGAGQYVPVERTYTEWYFSDFGPANPTDPDRPFSLDEGEDVGVPCQSCHMPAVEGFAADPTLGAPGEIPLRTVRQHGFVGGNTWAQDMIPLFFPDQLPLVDVFDVVQAAAAENLRQAAALSGELAGTTLRVRVENLSGHKLPTGYPEGRRMWLHVVATDDAGAVVYESGHYDASTAELVSHHEDPDLKIWAAELGVARPGRPAEQSFHFILNNVVLYDNRVPPRGFDPVAGAKFATLIVREDRDCRGYPQAFGATAEAACRDFDFDGDGHSDGVDVVLYDLPPTATRARLVLRYQTASKEYVEFLSNPENAGDYTDRFTLGLLKAWQQTGMSAPVDMACTEVSAAGTQPCPVS